MPTDLASQSNANTEQSGNKDPEEKTDLGETEEKIDGKYKKKNRRNMHRMEQRSRRNAQRKHR